MFPGLVPTKVLSHFLRFLHMGPAMGKNGQISAFSSKIASPLFAIFAHGPGKRAKMGKFLKPFSSFSFGPNLLKFGTYVPWFSPDKSTNPLLAIFAHGLVNGAKMGPISSFSSLSFCPNLLKSGIHIPWISPDNGTSPLFVIFAHGPETGIFFRFCF